MIAKEDLVATARFLEGNDVKVAPLRMNRKVDGLRGRGDVEVTTLGHTRLADGKTRFRIDAVHLPAAARPRARGKHKRSPEAAARRAARRRGRAQPERPIRVLIFAKVHGDEPAGSPVAWGLIQRFLSDRRLRERFDLTVVPMFNPTPAHDMDGMNHNRALALPRGKQQPVTRAIAARLGVRPFDLFLDLHADYLGGAFKVDSKKDPKLARRILSAVPTPLLLDPEKPGALVQGRPYKFHSLGGATSDTAGTNKQFFSDRGAPYSSTLEYCRTQSPARQMSTLRRMVLSTMNHVAKYGELPLD